MNRLKYHSDSIGTNSDRPLATMPWQSNSDGHNDHVLEEVQYMDLPLTTNVYGSCLIYVQGIIRIVVASKSLVTAIWCDEGKEGFVWNSGAMLLPGVGTPNFLLQCFYDR